MKGSVLLLFNLIYVFVVNGQDNGDMGQILKSTTPTPPHETDSEDFEWRVNRWRSSYFAGMKSVVSLAFWDDNDDTDIPLEINSVVKAHTAAGKSYFEAMDQRIKETDEDEVTFRNGIYYETAILIRKNIKSCRSSIAEKVAQLSESCQEEIGSAFQDMMDSVYENLFHS